MIFHAPPNSGENSISISVLFSYFVFFDWPFYTGVVCNEYILFSTNSWPSFQWLSSFSEIVCLSDVFQFIQYHLQSESDYYCVNNVNRSEIASSGPRKDTYSSTETINCVTDDAADDHSTEQRCTVAATAGNTNIASRHQPTDIIMDSGRKRDLAPFLAL